MAIFKRGKIYWYHFLWHGEHVQKSTKQGNPRTARQVEAACRTALARGEVGILEHKPAPTLREFEKRFMDSVKTRSADKPATVAFYQSKFSRLLEFTPLADTRLDRIDESLIDSFIQHRRKAVSPASTNRELATLRKSLRLAHEWRLIDRVPRIRLLPGERVREFTLSYEQEQAYLAKAPQPLWDFAVLALDSGLRISEALSLEWHDVHLEPVNGSKLGHLRVRKGKSRNAQRNLSLTPRVKTMLEARAKSARSKWVFPSLEDGSNQLSVFTLEDQHKRTRLDADLPGEFVIHSLRHSFGTRLGEAGAGAFEIMRAMGHSTVTVSQRYVHPTPEAQERAIERMDAMNRGLTESPLNDPKRQLPATIPATIDVAEPELVEQVL